jgi:cytochrome c peroxidase
MWSSTSRRRLRAGAALVACLASGIALAQGAAVPAGAADLRPDELRTLLRHGPWLPEARSDPTNRASGSAAARALGEVLFFDPRLSASGAMACASCHDPARAWTDGRARAEGARRLDRNTPTVLDVARQRWFGWDGGTDSLWAASIRPILDPLEMASDAARVAEAIAGDAVLACLYREAFGEEAAAGKERTTAVLVNTGKALAAFMETLASGRSSFDRFRDAIASGDREAAGRYPAAARRGLRTFVGRGHCSTCHFGPTFSNGEFADVGMPYVVEPGRVDPGRYRGIRLVAASPFNLLSAWNDDATRESATRTRHVELQHRNWGEFKVPSLRSAARTAPYMHDGRLATLRDVVRHYSELPEERLHSDGERILRRLDLSAQEVDDLVAFLESLGDGVDAYAFGASAPLARCVAGGGG